MRLTPMGFWESSVPPGYLTLSREAKEIFGFQDGQFDGRFATWFALIHPQDQKNFPDVEAEVRRGRRTFSYEYRFATPAGIQKRLKSDGEAVLGERGELLRLAGTVMEVPNLESQRSAVDLHAGGDDSAYEFVWEQDEDCRFVRFSGGHQMPITGLAGAVGLHRWELRNAVPLRSTWQEHIEALQQREAFRGFEYRFKTGDETWFVSTSGDPVFDSDGRFLGYRGTALNITHRVLAEEQARQGRVLLEHASRLGRLGAWELRVPEKEVTWSNGGRALLGYSSESQLTWAQALEQLDEEGRQALEQAIERCISRAAAFSLEVRAVTARSVPIWLRIVGEAERPLVGSVRRVLGSIQDISARKADERRLRELGERLTTTLESITEGFITLNRQWRFTYVNGAAERMSRRRREDLLGRVIWDIAPSFRGSIFHRECRRAIVESRSVRFQAYSEMVGAWLEVYAYPSSQGVAVCFQDVTQQKTAREALLASEERHRMLFETALDATFQTTEDGAVLAANPAACSMFGLTEAELCRRGRAGIVAKGDPRLEKMLRELDLSRRCITQLTMVRGDGSRFEAEVSVARYGGSDGKMYGVVVARDITERLRRHAEVMALNDNLVQWVRERTTDLELANRELKGFARSLAHDLRQPIAAAKAFSNALTRSLREESFVDAGQHAAQLKTAVDTMDAYVEALLSMAHISQVNLQLEEVDLSAIANSLLDQMQAQAPERKLVRQVNPGMCAEGDVTLLRMLLQNLIGNAWKFTSRKDVARISVTAEESREGRVVYCVRDNGAGFDMARAGKLFVNFQRLHAATDFPGTGIGLANVHRIVTRHGGGIWAESSPGAGATFRFTLGTPTGPQSRLLGL